MKLEINQLLIDSYAAQANENELTQIKGGTTPACYLYGGGAPTGSPTGSMSTLSPAEQWIKYLNYLDSLYPSYSPAHPTDTEGNLPSHTDLEA